MRSLRTSVLTLTMLLPFTGRCQQPFPTYADSGTWSVLHCITGIGTTCYTETYQYIGEDIHCSHIWSMYVWPGFGDPNIAYIRNEGQRTLLRRTSDCLDKEYVIYDFSMNVGDSLYAPMTMDIMDPDTTLFILQGIDTVDVLGIERRRFSLLFDPCNGSGLVNMPMQWIEGIGSTMHPFYPVDCLCDFCEQSLTLLCYDSLGVQLYVDPFYETCDTLITVVDEPGSVPENVLQVTYDATAGSLHIVVAQDAITGNRGLSLLLTTSDGRIVRRQQLPPAISNGARMDVASLACGAYVLLLMDARGQLASRPVMLP